MTYSDLVKEGIDRIYENDFPAQKEFITNICRDVRGVEPDIVFKARGIFVPNNDYLKVFFDESVLSEDYDFYSFDGICLWDNKLILPITNVVGDVVGLVGFDPFKYLEAHETKDWSLTYYSYSMKRVFNKGNYLYCLEGTYNKALEQGYLIITDGVFDTLAFANENYLSAAMMGSVLTQQIAAQLRFIPRIIVAMDNDEAGLKLYNRLRGVHDGVVCLRQGKVKDADDVLKSGLKEPYLKALDRCIHNVIDLDESVQYSRSFMGKLDSFE